MRQTVAFFTLENIGQKMAGPAIRVVELARVLSDVADVRIVAPEGSALDLPGVELRTFSTGNLREVARELSAVDVCIAQYIYPRILPQLLRAQTRLVLDLYDPAPLEMLEAHRDGQSAQARSDQLIMLRTEMMAADLILCASEKQRDLWIGALMLQGLLSPERYKDDPGYRQSIAVVPFGVPAKRPEHTKQVLKGVWPGIKPRDHVVLWGGGIWNWFDPRTALEAMAEIKQQRSDVKLFFMGVGRPPAVPEEGRRATEETLRTVAEKKLDDVVIINHDWIPYEERHNYLLESTVGISTHFDHLETQYSFRTRLLDYFWSGLPTIATSGDALADVVASQKAGLVVPPCQPKALASAILELVDDSALRNRSARNAEKIARTLTWEKAAAPLVAYIETLAERPRHVDSRAVARAVRRSWPNEIRSITANQGLSSLGRKAIAKPWNMLRRK